MNKLLQTMSDGHRTYWENDRLHRDGGLPAVEVADGHKTYYVKGKMTGLFWAWELEDLT